jgi:hypothetical protein
VQAGFDEEDIRQIVSWGYATDDPMVGALSPNGVRRKRSLSPELHP